jgi:hypothetical protein
MASGQPSPNLSMEQGTMTRSIAVLLGLGVALAAPAALAQNPQPAPPGVVPAPVAPPNAASPPPEKIAPPGKDVTVGKGLVRPPHGVDPQMVKQPPAEVQAK